jgi:hypothetical protein
MWSFNLPISGTLSSVKGQTGGYLIEDPANAGTGDNNYLFLSPNNESTYILVTTQVYNGFSVSTITLQFMYNLIYS